MPEPSLARTGNPPQQATDFARMHEAFAQTERGRWFLEEFIRRNGNPELAALLRAVERIEASLLARRTAEESGARRLLEEVTLRLAAHAPVAASAAASQIEAASGAIRAAIEKTRELGWAMREQNFDEALCDRLDARISEIVTACAVLQSVAASQQYAADLLQQLRELIARGPAQPLGAGATAGARPAAQETAETSPRPPQPEAKPDQEAAAPAAEKAASPQWEPDDSNEPLTALSMEAAPVVMAAQPAPGSPAGDPEPIQAIAREINHALGDGPVWEDNPNPADNPAAPPGTEGTTAEEAVGQAGPQKPEGPAAADDDSRRVSSPGQAAVLSLRDHMKAAQGPRRDPLAPLAAMSEEERIALFS